MGRQELLQPCCSSRGAWSVPMAHEAVLTALGLCDGDRQGQTLLRAFPTASPQSCAEDEEDVTIIQLLLLRFSPDNALARVG